MKENLEKQIIQADIYMKIVSSYNIVPILRKIGTIFFK